MKLQSIKLQSAMLSRIGDRKSNQDYCSYQEIDGFGCYLLADGLGAYRGSGAAARVTGESLLEAFTLSPGMSLEKLEEYLERARKAFTAALNKEQEQQNMKTTLVVLLTDFKRATWAHVGDSRLYYFASGALAFQTRDHSVPQAMASAGDIPQEEVRYHEDRNRLTRAFDGGDISRVTLRQRPVELQRGDAFLLCSDGFWERVLEEEMEEDLSHSRDPETWLSRMESRLLARAAQDQDNYSALAVLTAER